MKAFVEGLATLESGFYSVPVVYFCFSQLPTEQDDLVSNLAWEIEEALVEVFYLDADGIDFLNRVLGLLDGGALRHALTSDSRYIHQHAAGKEDVLTEHLEFGFHQIGTRLGIAVWSSRSGSIVA